MSLLTPIYLNQDMVQDISSVLIDGILIALPLRKLTIIALLVDIKIIIKVNIARTIKIPKVIKMIAPLPEKAAIIMKTLLNILKIKIMTEMILL